MTIEPQRGAIPITLGDPGRLRTLFFPMSATWLLVERYGVNFLGELYTVKNSKLTLKSLDALRFFLWAGLQAELVDTDETFTEDEAAELLRPWTFERIFNAVVMAVTGATVTPALPGKGNAAVAPASPSAVRAPAKASTSTKRRGSSAAR